MEYKIKAVREIVLKEEDIDDIMVTALEGGINYWCDEAEVVENKRVADWGHEQIARGGALIIHDAESTDCWELNLEKFLNGVKMWIEHGYADEAGAIYNLELDCGNIDAVQADIIIQFALFGDVVFG